MIIIEVRKKNNDRCEYYNFDHNYLILLKVAIMYAIKITSVTIMVIIFFEKQIKIVEW